jgi:quercetin dioxygenase-like cupin family protein
MGVGLESAEEIHVGGIFLRFLIDGPSTGASLSMFEMFVEPNGKMPVPHYHEAFDEMLYGLSGVLTMTLEGKAIDLGPGNSLYIPRGAVHGFENPHADMAKVLAVITPGIFGLPYFRDLEALLAAGGPPDPKAVAAVMLRHGLIPVQK